MWPEQGVRLYADDICKFILWEETCCILIQISLRFALERPIDNQSALIKVMASRWLDKKQLSEQNSASLLPPICVAQPRWVTVVGIYCCWKAIEMDKHGNNKYRDISN